MSDGVNGHDLSGSTTKKKSTADVALSLFLRIARTGDKVRDLITKFQYSEGDCVTTMDAKRLILYIICLMCLMESLDEDADPIDFTTNVLWELVGFQPTMITHDL